jgi:hypothetical protein
MATMIQVMQGDAGLTGERLSGGSFDDYQPDFCEHCGSDLVQLQDGQPAICEDEIAGKCPGPTDEHTDHSDGRVCQGIGCLYGDH